MEEKANAAPPVAVEAFVGEFGGQLNGTFGGAFAVGEVFGDKMFRMLSALSSSAPSSCAHFKSCLLSLI